MTLLNAGERSVGVAVPSGTTLFSISRGNPLKLIHPTEGVLATIAPSAVPRNAPHPNAAKLFMEYQAGPQMSDVVRHHFKEPLRPDVPAPEGSRPLDQITLLAPSAEEQEKGVPEVRELWRDTFGVRPAAAAVSNRRPWSGSRSSPRCCSWWRRRWRSCSPSA